MRGRPGMGFGQGPVVRGGRRAATQRLGERARDALTRGHEHQAAGRFAEAAAEFDKMSGVCRERGMTRSATWVSSLAATCHARAGDAAAAVAATERAIGDARADADPGHSARVFGELLASLAGTPLASAVPRLEEAIRGAVGVAPKAPSGTEVNRTLKRTLADHCETCGSAVDAASVRLSEDGADCPVCGAVV